MIGIYGTQRLAVVEKYLEEWRLGKAQASTELKAENTGRKRANLWLLERWEGRIKSAQNPDARTNPAFSHHKRIEKQIFETEK